MFDMEAEMRRLTHRVEQLRDQVKEGAVRLKPAVELMNEIGQVEKTLSNTFELAVTKTPLGVWRWLTGICAYEIIRLWSGAEMAQAFWLRWIAAHGAMQLTPRAANLKASWAERRRKIRDHAAPALLEAARRMDQDAEKVQEQLVRLEQESCDARQINVATLRPASSLQILMRRLWEFLRTWRTAAFRAGAVSTTRIETRVVSLQDMLDEPLPALDEARSGVLLLEQQLAHDWPRLLEEIPRPDPCV